MHDDAAELDAQRKALKNRDFETELLKKQLQLRGGSAPAHAPGLRSAPGASDDFENQHPNSPSCVNLGKTPGKITGQSTSKSSRRSAFAKHQD
jgi:hypothetical protein